ncbi:MAG: FHA domain-containing protein [Polaromonas sp.]|nr:FHA domain-containing protein [Polaromonas sp.]
MPKIIVSIDGVVIKEVQLTKDRTSLGRRPYNDIVIDNLAVSGEHAVLQMSGNEVYLVDLNSTNGTYVNGKAVKKQLLQSGDVFEIGKYHVTYVNEASSGSLAPPPADADTGPSAAIKVLSGAAAGRELILVKVVTTIGKPGVAVAAITKRPQGFVVTHVEGLDRPMLNGAPIGVEPAMLKNGDLLELAGTQMQFVQH